MPEGGSQDTNPGGRRTPDTGSRQENPLAESSTESEQTLAHFQSSLTAFQAFPAPNPVLEKLNETHIDKILEQLGRRQDQTHALRKRNQWLQLSLSLVAILVFGAGVVYLLPRDKELLLQLIQFLVLLAGGIGTGYGLKSRTGRD